MNYYAEQIRRITKDLYSKDYLTQQIVQAKHFIDNHLSEKILLDDIAAKAHMSKFHFLRIFPFRLSQKKRDIPMGEHSYLTVVSRDEQDGVEIVLEPMAFPPARVFQKALFDAGIPYTAFQVDDLEKEVARMTSAGVEFTMQPTAMGPTKLAVFRDTCGNNIQLFQII